MPRAQQAEVLAFYGVGEAQRHGFEETPEHERVAVEPFLASLDPDEPVIEIGSGQCRFAGMHPRLVLTDYSFEALARFGEGMRVQLDAQRLPFRDGSLPALFTVSTLEHVPDPAAAMAELDRCLTPGGRALIFPSWDVPAWKSRGLQARAYSELGFGDRVRKFLVPVTRSAPFRYARLVPRRVRREIAMARGRRLPFDFRPLKPNLDEYLESDSDAFSSMDPHACLAFFRSRGYDVRNDRGFLSRVLLRAVAIEVRKGGR